MESKFQTSFIPKRSFDDSGMVRVKTPINILFIISVLVVLLALGGAGGAFAYKTILEREIAAKKLDLKKKQDSFNYDAVGEVVRVDNKLKAASNLLNNHTAVSSLFTLLQKNTLKNVQFTSFNFSYLSNNKVSVSMKGKAKNFGVVARQEELFANSSDIKENFTDPLFSDLSLDDDGSVDFSFLTNIKSSLISYDANFASSTPPAANVKATTTPALTATTTTTQASTTKKTTP